MTDRPPLAPDRKRGNWGSIAFVIMTITLFVTFLVFAPLGRIGVAILVGGFIFPVIIALHYFIWGRWLRRVLEESAEEDSEF